MIKVNLGLFFLLQEKYKDCVKKMEEKRKLQTDAGGHAILRALLMEVSKIQSFKDIELLSVFI